MKHWFSRRVRVALASLAVLVPLSLYLLARFDVPTWAVNNVPRIARATYLTLNPVVHSDEDILGSVASDPKLRALQEALGRADTDAAWEAYRHARTQGKLSSALLEQSEVEELVHELKQRYPEELKRLLHEADVHADDRFRPFGTRELRLDRDFRWTTYPARHNDKLFIWEVNTLQHLPWLAQAYLFTGEKRYLAAIDRHLSSWQEQNPIGNSVNWLAKMEICLRLYSLMWTEQLLVRSGEAKDLFRKLHRVMYSHARFVAENYDRPRKKNNHVLFTAIGLYLYAAAYPEYTESSNWRQLGEQRLLEEVELQYTPRGVHKELAPLYHKALADALLQYALVKHKLKQTLPDGFRDGLVRQLEFLDLATGPNHNFVLVGDSDDHHFLRLSTASYRDTRPTLQLGAMLLNQPQLLRDSAAADWSVKWLLGLNAYRERRTSLGKSPVMAGPKLRVYRDEGMFRADTGSWSLFGDFTPTGMESKFAGHNHSDTTNLLLWRGNKPLLIDPGTYTYRRTLVEKGVVWRDYLRSSQAHNCAVVDEKSLLPPNEEEFGFARRADARLVYAESKADLRLIVGEHNGYQKLLGTSRRLFVTRGDQVLIVDWFPDSQGEHTLDQWFLFGGTQVAMHKNHATHAEMRLSWPEGSNFKVEKFVGSYAPPAGWSSPAYGILERSAQLRVRSRMGAGHASALLLEPQTESNRAVAQLSFEKHAGNVYIFSLGPETDTLKVLLNPGGRLGTWGSVSTDARIAVFEDKPGGRSLLDGGTRLTQQPQEPSQASPASKAAAPEN